MPETGPEFVQAVSLRYVGNFNNRVIRAHKKSAIVLSRDLKILYAI